MPYIEHPEPRVIIPKITPEHRARIQRIKERRLAIRAQENLKDGKPIASAFPAITIP